MHTSTLTTAERIEKLINCASELAREKIWGRLHILPLLQAEEDRDQVRRYYADKAREQQLLGSETKVYNSDRCVISSSSLLVEMNIVDGSGGG
jgi:hypothetical protein